MTREEKKKELTKLFLTAGVSFNDILDEAMNFQIDKACEWLKYLETDLGYYTTIDFIDQFKKAMES